MVLMFLRVLVGLMVGTYFKRVRIKNVHVLKNDTPMILALNHPNAFMDPVIFTLYAYPPKLKYLARGDAFKPGIATYLLERIGLAPIYGLRDGGKEGLQKNEETYRRVNELLGKGEKIMVFAEGLCITERRLRPLKKGVPRMVFGAMDVINNPDFVVVPVGVNYSEPSKVGSKLFYNVGEPIKVSDYYDDYKKHASKTYNKFLKDLEREMKSLITHINNPENDKVVVQLEQIFMKDLCKHEKLKYNNLEHEFLITKKITEAVNTADKENPELLEQIREKANAYTKNLNVFGVRDWLVNPANKKQLRLGNLILNYLVVILALPFFLRGVIGNYVPYRLSQYIVKRKVKHIEFYPSFNFGIFIFATLFFYILKFFIVYSFSPHIGWPLLVVLVSYLTGVFAFKFNPFILKTKGLTRAFMNKTALNNLRSQRAELAELFSKINKY